MKNLFVVDGASGTGKSDLLEYAANYSTRVSVVRKFSTRDMREYEKDPAWFLDLEFVTDRDFQTMKFEYEYVYSGHRYGFTRRRLTQALSDSKTVFVIVRNRDVGKQLMVDFDFINVVPIYVYTDTERIRKRLRRQRMTNDQIAFRLSRLQQSYEDYLKHSELYREILINNASTTDYHRLIDKMVDKYQHTPDIDARSVFILISFNPENPKLEDYAESIKRAVFDFDSAYGCSSLKDSPGSFRISDEAKKRIAECRLAVVDLTENSPNVFYELGYAHAIGKKLIITSHVDTPLLFYPKEYRVLRYRNSTDLYRGLLRELPAVLPRIAGSA